MATSTARRRGSAGWQYAFATPNAVVARRRGAGTVLTTRMEGRLAVGAGNRLEFQFSPAARGIAPGHPAFIRLDGTWRLHDDRTLIFAAQETTQLREHRVILRGGLVRADAHQLVFALEQEEGATPSQELTLTGRWTAAPGHRLQFLVKQADGTETPLTLQGAWHLGDRHEVLYRVATQRRARATTRVSTLSFAGAWDVIGTRQLRYQLLGASDSSFEFEAALRTPSVVARDGALVYDVGVRLARGRTQRVRVALFGTWKFSRGRAVEFEVPYAGGRVQTIRFAVKAAVSRRTAIELALMTTRGERLGLSVVLTRELTKDAKLFLRALQDGEERAIYGGVQVRF